MANYIGNKFGQQDVDKLVRGSHHRPQLFGSRSRLRRMRKPGRLRMQARRSAKPQPSPPIKTCCSPAPPPRPASDLLQREYEKRVDPNDKNAQALLDEMRQHIKKAGALTGWGGAAAAAGRLPPAAGGL